MAEKKLLMDEYVQEAPAQALKNIENSYELTKPMVDMYIEGN